MKIVSWFLAAVITLSLAFCCTLTGTVNFEGKTKKPKSIPMDSDPVCGASHDKKPMSESSKNQIVKFDPLVSKINNLDTNKLILCNSNNTIYL